MAIAWQYSGTNARTSMRKEAVLSNTFKSGFLILKQQPTEIHAVRSSASEAMIPGCAVGTQKTHELPEKLGSNSHKMRPPGMAHFSELRNDPFRQDLDFLPDDMENQYRIASYSVDCYGGFVSTREQFQTFPIDDSPPLQPNQQPPATRISFGQHFSPQSFELLPSKAPSDAVYSADSANDSFSLQRHTRKGYGRPSWKKSVPDLDDLICIGAATNDLVASPTVLDRLTPALHANTLINRE